MLAIFVQIITPLFCGVMGLEMAQLAEVRGKVMEIVVGVIFSGLIYFITTMLYLCIGSMMESHLGLAAILSLMPSVFPLLLASKSRK